jgi:predicted MFS family arabinose efflux permease
MPISRQAREAPATGADARLHIGPIAALAVSAFVFVTAETLPVGLLPQIAHGLSVSQAEVGLLLTSYAAVAAVSTIPLTALTMRVPRQRLIVILVGVFAVSQFAASLAPTFLILTITRLLCALAHGVFWSAIAPAAARLAPPGQAGRATSLVFVGNSAALVLGVPLGTALGQLAGWRVAIAVLGFAGALSAVALMLLLPELTASAADLAASTRSRLRSATRIIRSRAITPVCAVTTVLVIGQFAAYTYITPLALRDGGLHGVGLSALLLGYGLAGLASNLLVGHSVDRRPGPMLATSVIVVAAALVLLSFKVGVVLTIFAVIAWGAGFVAVPVSLQAAILRVAPEAQESASAVYVVAFQIGIASGAFIGDRFVAAGHLSELPIVGAALAVIAIVIVFSARRAFPLLDQRPMASPEPIF